RRIAPAFARLVDRLDRGLRFGARRQAIEHLFPEAIAGADLDLLEAVEHVELGQRDAVDAGGLHRLAHHHRIEPAAAPLAPRDHAEFLAALAEHLADLVLELARERPAADARRIGFADAEHIADRARPEPRARRRLARVRVRRSHVRI